MYTHSSISHQYRITKEDREGKKPFAIERKELGWFKRWQEIYWFHSLGEAIAQLKLELKEDNDHDTKKTILNIILIV